MRRPREPSECPLCERTCPPRLLERHHLRTRKKDRDDVELICRQCHRTVHALFTNAELRDPAFGADTVEGLLEKSEFSQALTFIRKQPPETYQRVHGSERTRKRKRRG